MHTPIAGDVVLVSAGTSYSILRASGHGTAAYRGVSDPPDPMPRKFAIAIGRALAARDQVTLWVLDQMPATLVECHRPHPHR